MDEWMDGPLPWGSLAIHHFQRFGHFKKMGVTAQGLGRGGVGHWLKIWASWKRGRETADCPPHHTSPLAGTGPELGPNPGPKQSNFQKEKFREKKNATPPPSRKTFKFQLNSPI